MKPHALDLSVAPPAREQGCPATSQGSIYFSPQLFVFVFFFCSFFFCSL